MGEGVGGRKFEEVWEEMCDDANDILEFCKSKGMNTKRVISAFTLIFSAVSFPLNDEECNILLEMFGRDIFRIRQILTEAKRLAEELEKAIKQAERAGGLV